MDTALIIDGQNLFMRALFASRNTKMSSQGISTGPLVIFINSLAKHIQQESPTRLIICWDGGVNPFRVKLIPSYKAHRKPVIDEEAAFRDDASELVRIFLAFAGVHQFQFQKLEADDLIAGAWATLLPADADRIVILSEDKDFLQLVGENPHGVPTEIIRLSSAGTPTDRWDVRRMRKEMGYEPRHWPLVTALSGDRVDGVPGLPGIGPKRAQKLLEAAEWDLEKVDITSEQLVHVRRCFDAVNLRDTDIPVDVPPWSPTRRGSVLWPRLLEWLSSLELRTVTDRLEADELWSPRARVLTTQCDQTPVGRSS